ncbi:MAG: peroxiredoxin [Caldisericia bacterium]|nr:peroxiredoxin [Caldisericia bacterium]
MTKKYKVHIDTKSPDFQLLNHEEKDCCLDSFKGKWLVLFFYPKDTTPSSIRQLTHFSKAEEEFKKRDAEAVGVSRNLPKSHVNVIHKHNLQVTLLSDPGRDAILKYNAWGKKNNQGKGFVGVKRTTYIIDPDGVVKFRFKHIKIASHIDEILEKLDELQNSSDTKEN